MFEKTCDIFLQQANPGTPMLTHTELPELFKHIRKSRLLDAIKDLNSFNYFKEKMIEMEKILIGEKESELDMNKLIFPLIGFAKVYTNFCYIDNILIQKKLNFFPNRIFTLIFKYLHENLNDVSPVINYSHLYEEISELLYEISEAVNEDFFIVGTTSYSKLYHHLLNLLFNEKISESGTTAKKQSTLNKYVIEICIFLYTKTLEETDKKFMIDEIFARMQMTGRIPSSLNIEVENRKKINVFSYFFLKAPQSQLFLYCNNISYSKDNELTESSQNLAIEYIQEAVKVIRNVVIVLFKKSKEDLKSKTNISKFLKIFLNDILTSFDSLELLTNGFYHQAFCNIIIDFVNTHKSETDGIYKNLLLDLIKMLLQHFITVNQFLEGKSQKFNEVFLGGEEKSTSTNLNKKPTKKNPSKIKVSANLNACDICKMIDLTDEEIRIPSSNPEEKEAICITCFLRNLLQELAFPKKPDFSPEKLIKNPQNPLFFYLILHYLNQRALGSKSFASARQFFLFLWIFNLNEEKVVKKIYVDILDRLVSQNFNPKTILPFIKSSEYSPNEFLGKYIWNKIFFSPENERVYQAFQSVLLILSNESISIRNKVLDVIQSLIAFHPEYIFNRKIQEIITFRVLDNSNSVRISALEIIMKFYEKEWVEENYYLDLLLERLNDIDSGIRKKILYFFEENSKFLKENQGLREKISQAVVYKIYDNEEISGIASKITLILVFDSFKEKSLVKKKGKVNKKTKKDSEFYEDSTQKSYELCMSLSKTLKINEWFQRILKFNFLSSEEFILSESEIRLFIEKILKSLSDPHKQTILTEETLTNIDFLFAFSKYFPSLISQELNFFTNYLTHLSEITLLINEQSDKSSIASLISHRRQAILLLLEILDCVVTSIRDPFAIKKEDFLSNMKEIEMNLIQFTLEEALEVLHKALKLLISIVKNVTSNFFLIKNLYIQTYAFVLKKKLSLGKEKDSPSSLTIDSLQHFMRCLYILTFLTRYFDISEFFDEEEKESPEYQEENLIKIIYNELVLFCQYKNPLIAQTCIECIMILCEKQPKLIFETRSFVEGYLLRSYEEKENNEGEKEVILKIYSSFLNLIVRHEEKIRRQNSMLRHLNNKKLLKKKAVGNRKKEENSTQEEDEESSEDEEKKAIDDKDYEKLASMIKEITKNSFSHHIFSPEPMLRSTLLHLLQTLISKGHLSSYETNEYFICFLCDSTPAIRAFCQETLKNEWKSNRFTVISCLNKGLLKCFEYLKERQGNCHPFTISPEGEIANFFTALQETMGKGNEIIANHFVVLLLENFALYSKPQEIEYLQFVCLILLTIQEYNLWEIYEVLNRLFELFSKNYYKNIMKIKVSSLKTQEEELQTGKTGEEMKESDLFSCFGLVVQILTFHLLVVKNKNLKELCPFGNCTPQEYLEKLEKLVKKSPFKISEEDTAGGEKKGKCNLVIEFETVQKLNQFIEKFLDPEFYKNNKENVYLLYKKIKFLMNYPICDEENVLFSFQQEMLENYREEERVFSKKKSKSKGKGKGEKIVKAQKLKPKKNKNVALKEDEKKKFESASSVGKEAQKKKKKEVKTADTTKYEGRLRKRKEINFNEEDDG